MMFDPATWIDQFVRSGGSYAITVPEGRLWLGVIGVRTAIDEHTAVLIGYPDRVAAIVSHTRERCLIAP